MPIKFRCEHCRQLLGISKTKAGKVVDCPTCGRAVRVPSLDGKSDPVSIPNWDPQDESLVNALNALASLTEEPGERGGAVAFEASNPEDSPSQERPPSSDRPQQPVVLPAAIAIPEPIEMPPLEAPVVLPEPASSPGSAESRRDDPEKTEEPWAKLATLPVAAAGRDSLQGDRPNDKQSMSYQPGKSVTLPIALLLVAMAFLLGFFVGNFVNNNAPAATSKLADADAVPAKDSSPAATESAHRSAESTRHRAVEGRITYLSATGSSQSDAGAVVIVLPAYRNSSTKLPIVGFRPADSSEDRELAKEWVRALGGDLAVVDENGLYACDLPQAGEYHLIILSRHLERAESESLAPAERTMLGEYFDRPQQLVGQLKFHVSDVNYRGETTEIRDHTFGREG